MTDFERWPADNTPSSRWPIYTRGNIGEIYPAVVLPLEWELSRHGSEQGWRAASQKMGIFHVSDFDEQDSLEVVGVFGGYAYFNASLMRLLGVRTPGLSVDVVDVQFLGEADVPKYSERPGDKNLVATATMVRTAVKTLFARSVPVLDEVHTKVDAHLAETPPLDADDAVLWDYIAGRLAEVWPYLIEQHVMVTMQATIAAGALSDLCESSLGDPDFGLSLTTGLGDVRSAQPAAEMWVLANETAEEDFDAAFGSFLERHGHRGPNEFSLAGRDWAAFPEIAMAAISSMRGAEPERSPAKQLVKMAARREAALEEAKAAVGIKGRWLAHLIKQVAMWSRARELSKDEVIRAVQPVRHALLELGRRAVERGGDPDPIAPLLLTEEEFLVYLAEPSTHLATIAKRRVQYERFASLEPPFAFTGTQPSVDTWQPRSTPHDAAAIGTVLQGAGGAPGVATGRARRLTDPGDPTALDEGDILVAPLTDPSWTPLFVAAGAVVVEIGAAMSHSMIVSRELGIPCVVGLADAMSLIPDGALVTVDGQAGTVTIVAGPDS